jgi:hypothetical protein
VTRLTPGTVTSASRIMLPTYPLLCLVLAVNYSSSPPRLMDSPALRTADQVLPLPVWGAMFAVAAFVLLVGLLAHHRFTYVAGLVVMCAAMLAWTAVFIYAAVAGPASYTAAAWPAFACAASWASIRSLSTRETS